MKLNPATIEAAESIRKILDELTYIHSSNDVTWLIQAVAAYTASGDTDLDTGEPPAIACTAAQHVRMRRVVDDFLATSGQHDISEVLTEILVRQGEP